MGDDGDGRSLAAHVARHGAAFALAWSSLPPDLPEKISVSQLRALTVVRGAGRLTVSELAQALDALPSSATRLCDRLVAAGYIERAPDVTNRRYHHVALTPDGERLLAALDDHREQALAGVLGEMSASGRQSLLTALAEFSAHCADPPSAGGGAAPHLRFA